MVNISSTEPSTVRCKWRKWFPVVFPCAYAVISTGPGDKVSSRDVEPNQSMIGSTGWCKFTCVSAGLLKNSTKTILWSSNFRMWRYMSQISLSLSVSLSLSLCLWWFRYDVRFKRVISINLPCNFWSVYRKLVMKYILIDIALSRNMS